jgi:PAS domain S-box-containing protein
LAGIQGLWEIWSADEKGALSPRLRSLILFRMAVRVESQDVMDLSREAFLTVCGSRVTGANQAARSLFEACGRQQALAGASLDELWESADPAGGDFSGSPRLVRACASGDAQVTLELDRSRPSAPDAEYAIRVTRVDEAPDRNRRLEWLWAAVNEASDSVMVIDPRAMSYLDVNEAASRVFGLSRQDMLRLGPVGTRAMGCQTERELRDYCHQLIEMHPRTATGTRPYTPVGQQEHFVEYASRAVKLEGHWLIVTVGRDVTDRVRAERELHDRMKELARSNQDLEQFAYVTSHDLSEPLRMVASYTQLLARRYGTHFDEDGREFMGYIVTGAQRMKRLIDDLLAYSRAGRAGAAIRESPLDGLLDDAVRNLAHAIRESDVRIERPQALPALPCDKTGMTQVFQNLIANAMKFKAQAPAVIRIEAKRDNGDWTFSVTDNGIGIEPQYFDRIFVIFQRLHGRDAYEGTGIGLAICKKIVERHGGTIWVESAPGQGSTFKFRLPVQPDSFPDFSDQADGIQV